MQNYLFNILREGQLSFETLGNRYPGPLIENLRSQTRTCQVLQLARLQPTSPGLSLASTSTRGPAFYSHVDLLRGYASCNSSIHALTRQYSDCFPVALLSQIFPTTSQSVPSICFSECYDRFSSSLRAAQRDCAISWSNISAYPTFTGEPLGDAFTVALRGAQFSRLLFLANVAFQTKVQYIVQYTHDN